jgi:hypothetical protein
LKAQWEAQ